METSENNELIDIKDNFEQDLENIDKNGNDIKFGETIDEITINDAVNCLFESKILLEESRNAGLSEGEQSIIDLKNNMKAINEELKNLSKLQKTFTKIASKMMGHEEIGYGNNSHGKNKKKLEEELIRCQNKKTRTINKIKWLIDINKIYQNILKTEIGKIKSN